MKNCVSKLATSACGLLLLMLFLPNATHPQAELNRRDKLGLPNYEYELANVQSNQKDKSRLNVFLQISYDELQFVKVDSGYKAEYEVTVSITNDDKDQLDGKIWNEEILVWDYEATNSRESFSSCNTSLHVPPGKYEIYISLLDKDTKKARVRKQKVELKDFNNQKLSISDVIMLSHLTTDSLGIKTIRPLISHGIHEGLKKIYAYFEIYSQRDVKAFTVEYEIKRYKDKKVLSEKIEIPRQETRTMYALMLDSQKLASGRYILKLKIKDGEKTVKAEKSFTLRWRGLPKSVFDMESAIAQLKYIANSSEIKKMRKAKGKKKTELFEQFWKKRDPTPGTDANEHMEEYYRRIHYANEAFTGFRVGWKSDMGMVYIILGNPSDIERHPFESGSKPYQIWYYYDINRKFVFVDETGFGEYRLLSQYWDDLFRDIGWRP